MENRSSMHRPQLMCEYSGPGDDLRFTQVVQEQEEVIRSTKRQSMDVISQVGLNPFWRRNQAPRVYSLLFFGFSRNMNFLLILIFRRSMTHSGPPIDLRLPSRKS